MAWSYGQRCLAEFIGTFGLLVSVTGGALLALNLPDFGAGDPNGRVLLISFSLGLGVLGMAYAFGDISGGSFNPAITFGLLLSGRLKVSEAVGYWISEFVGGIVGVAAIAGVAHGSTGLWNAAQLSALASQGYSGNGSPYTVAMGSVFLLEIVMTFFLVIVVLMATREGASAKNLAPVGIALTLAMTNLVAIPIDGASVNPARSLAPALLSYGFAGDHWALQQYWLFLVAPLVGGLVAALVERAMRPRSG